MDWLVQVPCWRVGLVFWQTRTDMLLQPRRLLQGRPQRRILSVEWAFSSGLYCGDLAGRMLEAVLRPVLERSTPYFPNDRKGVNATSTVCEVERYFRSHGAAFIMVELKASLWVPVDPGVSCRLRLRGSDQDSIRFAYHELPDCGKPHMMTIV